MAASEWQPHSIRGFISAHLRGKLRLSVELANSADGKLPGRALSELLIWIAERGAGKALLIRCRNKAGRLTRARSHLCLDLDPDGLEQEMLSLCAGLRTVE